MPPLLLRKGAIRAQLRQPSKGGWHRGRSPV